MKKVTILGMVLVLCLAVVGIGYAHWTKDLFIQGTVETGTLDAVWGEIGGFDTEPAEKDVSRIECTANDDTLLVQVFNAYPCITYTNEAYIQNTGSIPLHIDIVTLTNDYPWLEITLGDLEGTLPIQVHPGERIPVVITVHLANDAPQLSVVDFSVEINTVNWNESLV